MDNQTEMFKTEQRKLSDAAYTTFRSYGYEAGYFHSMAARMFESLSKRHREEFLAQMIKDAAAHKLQADLRCSKD